MILNINHTLLLEGLRFRSSLVGTLDFCTRPNLCTSKSLDSVLVCTRIPIIFFLHSYSLRFYCSPRLRG